MSKLNLILKDISDVYVRDNFFRLKKFLDDQILFEASFEFFEIDIKIANAKYPIKHGLPFTPTDIIFLAVQGDYNFYFRYSDFDKENIYVKTSGPCVLRFLAGRLPNSVRNNLAGKYDITPPSGGSIVDIASLSPAITVTSGSGPHVKLNLNMSLLTPPSAPLLQMDVVAGEPISVKKAVYYDYSTSRVFLGNPTILTKSLILGIAKTSAAAAGDIIKVVTFGNIVDAGFAFTTNSLIFLGSNGSISSVNLLSGYRVVVGKSLTSDTLFVGPQEPILLA